ncbi:MAG: NAD-dependent epimerase/dehydratase family protein [Candidatus Colwellbacteria bacterium]|nr:NAD-dependent epimerase/dehydratase family protein [Candidatus Colwellbacteria bacterium]
MKAFVIGGAGFIGSHLVVALKREGHEVFVVDKRNGLDMQSLRFQELFQKERPEVVLHLAGPIGLRNPNAETVFEDCVSILLGTKNVLEAARVSSVRRIIFSSSSAVYENAKEVPTPETYTTSSSSLYGIMTILMEKLILDYSAVSKISTVILRLSNVYGPGQWRNVVRIFAEDMQKNISPKIAGDGSSTRDFVHVGDVVDAFIKAANSNATGIFNIGSSKETSLKELFETLANTLQWNGAPEYVSAPQSGVSRSALDCTKAKKDLGWRAKTTLKDGLIKTFI